MAIDYSSFFPNIEKPDDGGRQYICSGRYADCYRVNIHGKWLFVKVLKREYADNDKCRHAFSKEQELGMMIDHPNIVRYQLVADDNAIWQDYVDGLSLDRFIEKNPKYFNRKDNRRKFVSELLSAVSYLHAHHVIHLDLKPQNIIITTQGNNVKLVDLGMAFHDTFTSTFGGTEGYSAPEIINGEEVKPTFAADIYSIGRLMELVGVKQRGIIKQCTMEKAADRYQSVDGIATALRRQRHKSHIFLSAAIAVIVCALIGGALLLRQKEEPDLTMGRLLAIAQRQSIADSEEAQREMEKALQQEREKAQPVKEEDSIDNQIRQYFIDMNEYDKRYQRDMKEMGAKIEKEESRIYAPFMKKYATMNYKNDIEYYELRKIHYQCYTELRKYQRELCDTTEWTFCETTNVIQKKYEALLDSAWVRTLDANPKLKKLNKNRRTNR